MGKVAFDIEKYKRIQSEKIRERAELFNNKLYLEFGGKLFDDHHASRVLPGFAPNTKIEMLKEIADQSEILLVINANDIQKNKVRADLGITYDQDALRLIDAFRGYGLYVSSVVITQYSGQEQADIFRHKLDEVGMRTYLHYPIAGYPANIPLINSDNGYGKNDYVETTRPIVVVTAPGPGSGKLATCLSQLYHEHKRGIMAGYAKFETFPIWNLPLNHPVNIAYEAATADLDDVNMIDPFHLEAYNITTVNYNRDVEAFPVLNRILGEIMGESPYKSPTDMGVNMIGYCITDQDLVMRSSYDEIIRRYYRALVDVRKGVGQEIEISRIQLLMNKAGISPDCRVCIQAAKKKAEETGEPAVAVELEDGRILTGKTSRLLGASSAALLNSLKAVAGLDDVMLIAPDVIMPVQELKTRYLGGNNPRLHTDETLIALSISASTHEPARIALEALPLLRHAQVHSTVILSQVDIDVFNKLGMNLTMEPVYQAKKLYHSK